MPPGAEHRDRVPIVVSSPTKLKTALAPEPVRSRTCWAMVPVGGDAFRAALNASFSASSLVSTTMTWAGVIALRHWMPMWPSPPASTATANEPGPSAGTAFLTAW